jgi:hypothetical protein
MSAFQVGNTYTTRSICDHNCIISVTIAKRTEKTVTDSNGKNFRIKMFNGVETIAPWGRYSMAPTIRAAN